MLVIWNVYVCVNFGDKILLRGGRGGGNVKPRKNAVFLKKGKTIICHYSTS